MKTITAAIAIIATTLANAAELWNQDWRFTREGAEPDAADAAWESVSVPHTVQVEGLDIIGKHYQGLCAYHKHFTAPTSWRGKKVQVRFDGAMQVAEVWLNGKQLTVHQGGYLPFIVDLTGNLNWTGDNVLALRLDNRDIPTVPPGKPLKNMDFTYCGGLYRDVRLLVSDPLHISDVFEANEVAGGGIFIRTESADAEKAVVTAQADIRNDGATPMKCEVRFAVAGAASVLPQTIALEPGAHAAVTAKLNLLRPKLWSPDYPALYTLRTELKRDGQVLEVNDTRFGVRTLAYDDKLGFVLNGQPLRIRGANRHQDFPWLGNAVADNAQFRDLARLKDAGFNFLRLCHYPQAESVMDACDEWGLMNSPCTPGWQWWSNDPGFLRLARQNIRDMVRWHRNHPSIIMWEVSLNETYGHDAFFAECCQIARDEYPGGQLFTAGDSYASKDVRHYDVPYCGWPGNGYNRPAAPGFEGRCRSFIREYGDNDCAINTRIVIGGGAAVSERNQLAQAWAHQWTHNTNNGWPWPVGDCLWVGVDHFRGCGGNAPISTCGALNYLREPKFSYYFFQSQRPQQLPSLFIANYWTPRPTPNKVVVFSNCDEVELRLNGRVLYRQKPDTGADSRMGDPTPEDAMLTNYMKTGKSVQDFEKMIEERKKQNKSFPVFTGGDCRHLDHAPFTFPLVPYEAGGLTAVGYIKGKEVIQFTRRTPGKPAALHLVAEILARPLAADGADADYHANLPIHFTINGPAHIVSPATANSDNDGIATLLIQAANQPGNISITAAADGLKPALVTIESKAP